MIDMNTVAVPCDGRVEYQNAVDEYWLCTDQYILIYVVLGNINKDKFQILSLLFQHHCCLF